MDACKDLGDCLALLVSIMHAVLGRCNPPGKGESAKLK